MISRLEGQVALVTGGSSGIGKGCVLGMAAEGASVIINYYKEDTEARLMVEEINRQHGKAIAVQADVSSQKEVSEMFRQGMEHFGHIDIVVCNAGIQQDAPFTQMKLADWQKVLDTNLTGAFLTAQEGVSCFLKQDHDQQVSASRGKIIFMSSVHQEIPWAGHVNYAASKGGMEELMRSMAQELSQKGIRVNAVAPGAIRTSINEQVWGDKNQLEKLLTLIPYGRMGEPEDVAKAVAWLASDESDYVIGTTLFVDGGMMLYPGFTNNG